MACDYGGARGGNDDHDREDQVCIPCLGHSTTRQEIHDAVLVQARGTCGANRHQDVGDMAAEREEDLGGDETWSGNSEDVSYVQGRGTNEQRPLDATENGRGMEKGIPQHMDGHARGRGNDGGDSSSS